MCVYLTKETEIVPWAAALRQLSSWKVTLADTDIIPMINGFILNLIGPQYDTIGWEDEGSHSQK